MDLQDKVIIVTGGTSGIGEACSRYFSELGAKVAIASNQPEAGAVLADELQADGRQVRFIETDVSVAGDVEKLVGETLDAFGRIDCLHSNAGTWLEGTVKDFTEEDWQTIMDVNVKGNFLLLKHIVPVMEEQGKGVVLITTSVAAFVGFPAHALYCASKAALEALIRCLAIDHAGVIRIVGICPGTIDTPLLRASCAGWDTPVDELLADVAEKIPVRRLGEPEDVAKVAAFLLSDDAGYINGSSVMLEGGTLALPPW